MNKIHVGFSGYVSIPDGGVFGDDLTVVNTARVSYNKKSDEWGDKDERLLKYLWDHEHTSPFRHASIRFEIKAPIFVLRQWMKHQIGCSWNEISYRYTQLEEGEQESYYHPNTFRAQDTKNKQSSASPLPRMDQIEAAKIVKASYEASHKAYNDLINLGVCREQARIVLPVGIYSKAVWTASLQAIMHFLELRLDESAQKEIRDYAVAIKTLAQQHFPQSIKLLNKEEFV
jgi:thymidylate synthase (FAD)